MYFASRVDSATTCSFFELQEVEAPFKMNTKPSVLLRSSLSPPQSAYVNRTTLILGVEVVFCGNRISFAIIPFMYLRIHLATRR